MITSISASISQNAGLSQNIVRSGPSPTSGGSGGLADSPWPMFRQNLNHTGVSPYDTSSNPGLLKWSFTTGSGVFSSPAIGSDGTIYVGSSDYKVYAVNPDSTEKWNFTTDGQVDSSPAIGSDNTIYVGSDDTNLYAINTDGTEKWRFTTGHIIQSSPTIGSDGTVYVGSDDTNLYAINTDGTEKWRFTTGGQVDSSPAIASDGTIYISSQDSKLYAIKTDGIEKWRFTTGHMIQSSPAIGSDGTIYVGSEDKKLYAINPNGTEKWSFKTGGFIFSSPAIGSDGTIYVGSYDNKLYAINQDGTEKWSFKTGWGILSSSAISSNGTIHTGSTDGKLYAINSDGNEKWNFTTDSVVSSSPSISSDGTIYVGSRDGKLYAIGIPLSLTVNVTSHFTELNSAAQSSITVHVTDGTNPVQGATVNLVSDNGGIFSPQSGITDANGDFKSIFNAPTVTSQIICRISAEASKTGYNDDSGYVDVTINPIPWPMFRHNHRHMGSSPYDTSANPGKLKWSFTTGNIIFSSPAIDSDGTIYIGSNDDKLYAINPDGTEKWSFGVGDNIRSVPAINSDGIIYVGSDDNNLYAINPDGTEKWSFTTRNEIYSSPVIDSIGTIYVGSGSKLYAISPNGTERWNYVTIGGVISSPAIDSNGTIYVGSSHPGNKLYAINTNGTEKWNFSADGDVYSSPAIGSDGTIYVGSVGRKLYAIYPNGTEKWNLTTGDQIDSSPAIGFDGTIYVGSRDYRLYAINPNGTTKWSFTTGNFIYFSSPAIGSEGTIYIGSQDNKLYAINPDGSEKWSFATGNLVFSPSIGSDGTIYVGSYDHKLYAIGKGGNPPITKAGTDQVVYEGEFVYFNASSSYDPDGTIESYEWDFDAGDGLWWETGTTPDSTNPTPTHVYGDDGVFIVTLRVTDNDNLSATDTCNVTVQNMNPTVTIESITMEVEIGLRVAGRKYNNVSMTLYEEGSSIGYVSIERLPGSPNQQMAWIPVSINFSKSYNATVIYTPEDPPNIGGNPVWIYIKSKDGSMNRIHHTFNVQQSKKRDSDHWNHVEPWEVDLNCHFIGLPFEITSHVTDPGSDDETLTFTYGSQVKTVTYLNNPPNLDSYPSPEINSVDIMDTTILIYVGAGTVTLVVKDDDNVRMGVGEGTDFISVG
jgi:outer membrane protein assembly factor BamB